ncbi:MAG: PAS domain-containing protein [Alphaproteobacteria bacterium]|nr:PAS domain-containing protein [Alphaproteobacteria bacterium]MBU1514016.1 PAS domain-containing protein [Alphaproteobacteria bacterium]MBU2093044.1 PAS domain-containing protein [Alphaproteobacteria bacterium]MBU2151753.1 PAS domain-containing protein [Alphaproteobacteria bacterium]MBU2361724.1 PAS domain-containing protein [Alphaproteobacteria bacterium]
MPSDLPPLRGLETVSAADLRRNFGVWQERAFSAPVVVARHGKPRLVLTSAEHYFTNGAGKEEPLDLVQNAIAAIPEHSSEGLLVLDRDLRVLAVNRVFEDMVGRHAARLVGQCWEDLFPEATTSLVGDQFRHVLRTGASVQFETPSMMADGRQYALSVFPHEHGVAALIMNRTVETEMRQQIEEYRSLAASFGVVPDAAYVRINLRAFIESASPQFTRLMGFDPKARPHLIFTDILRADARAEILERLDDVLSGGRPARFPTTMLTASGDAVDVKMALAPIWRGPAPEGAMAFFHLDAV